MTSVGHYQDPPLDYQYLEIKSFSELPSREPNSGKRKEPTGGAQEPKPDSKTSFLNPVDPSTPYPPSPGKAGSSASPNSPAKKSPNNKKTALPSRSTHKVTTSIRLAYNKLEDWSGMIEAIDAVLPASKNLEWLDLSFNAFTSLREKRKANEKQPSLVMSAVIGSTIMSADSFGASCGCVLAVCQALLHYPRLRTLNLHANKISDLSGVTQLSALSNLRKLTLFGNDDVTEKPFYRLRLIHELPQLRVLDDSVITKQERRDAQTWAEVHKNRKKKGNE